MSNAPGAALDRAPDCPLCDGAGGYYDEGDRDACYPPGWEDCPRCAHLLDEDALTRAQSTTGPGREGQ